MRRSNEIRTEGRLPTTALVVALALGLTVGPGTGRATISVRDLWAPDGYVAAVVRANNTIYIGGSFSRVGQVVGPAIALDLGTAVPQTPYPNVAGVVLAVEPDGSGGWYIGGQFTAVQGQRRMNVAQIDAAGQVTPWNPRVDGTVLDIAVGSGVVYVVGQFTSVGTMWGGDVIPRFGAAAINAANGLVTHWNPDPSTTPTQVEVGGGRVYLAGDFTTIYFHTSNLPRPNLAEFTEVVPGDLSSGAATPLFAGSDPTSARVDALELSGGKLFFSVELNPPLFNSEVRIYDLTSGSFLPYNVAVGGQVYDIALDQAHGTFFVGGVFMNIGGQSRANLAAVNLATGTVVPSWSPSVDGNVGTLGLGPNGLIVGGDFYTLGGLPRRGLGLVDPVSAAVLGWDAALGGDVSAVEVDPATGRAYVGGDFTTINTVPRSNLAAFDETSGALLAWNPTTDATVEALMVSGGTLYVGGQFSTVNGTTRNRAAAVDAVTGALTAFNPNVANLLGFPTVKTFAISGSTVYMGGKFTTVRGVDRVGIAAVNATTGAVQAWDPGSNGTVNSITYVPGGVFTSALLVVGGEFTFIGGASRNYVALLDPVTAASGGLDSPDGPVQSMYVEPLDPGFGGYNEIFMGGVFTSVAGQPRNHIASVAAFGLVTSWSPNPNGTTVLSIAKFGNTVYVGGTFTTIGGQNRTGFAAIDGSGAATPWDPHAAAGCVVYSTLESAGTLFVGGAFISIADTPHSYFAGMSEIVTAVESGTVPGVTPTALKAAPNPFDQSTNIQFALPSAGETRVTVYDVAGRRVREIHNGWLPAGRYTMPWDGRGASGKPVAAGVYFLGVRTQAGSLGSKVYRVK